jgi:hypothetical protein
LQTANQFDRLIACYTTTDSDENALI